MNPAFVCYLLRFDAWTGRLAEYFTGATIKHLTGRSLKRIPIPVPPLEHQAVIVHQIEEHMGLCDDLEVALHTRSSESEGLARALAGQLAMN
jgi:type I restriction enzyme S subunit